MDPLSDPELTPAQEQRVRRLLADARHEEPVPDDVAARLDEVLARLSAERRGGDGGAEVVDLADRAEQRRRGRRRLGAGLLVAAAAVVAGGVAVPSLLGGGAEMSSESQDAAAGQDSGADSGAESEAQSEGGPAATAGVPTLRADAFRADASAAAGHRAPSARRNGAVEATPRPPGWCAPRKAWDAGRADRLLAVRYDDGGQEAGWLLLRRGADGARVAELFLCAGGARPERSATLPRR